MSSDEKTRADITSRKARTKQAFNKMKLFHHRHDKQ